MAGRLIEVALDDGPDGPGVVRTDAPWPLRRWAMATAGLAVVLGVTVVVQGGVETSRESVLDQAVGLVQDLPAARHAVWRADGSDVLGVVDDLVLVVGPQGDGLTAVRLEDGRPVWSVPEGACRLIGLDPDALPWTQWPVGRAARVDQVRVVCERPSLSGYPQATIVDPATGGALATVGDAPGDLLPVGGRLVELSLAGGADSVRVRVWSLRDGAGAWSADVPAPVHGSSGGQAGAGVQPLTWGVMDGSIVVDSGGARTALDLATGSELAAGGDGLWTLSGARLSGGLRVVTSWTRRSDDLPFTTVTDESGPVWVLGDRTYREPAVRDAAARAVVLATGDGTAAGVDPWTGVELWRGGTGWRPVVQVSGVVVLADERVEARDDRTGDVLWTASVREQATALSDGATLGLLDLEAGELVVRDLRTGAERWRQPLPLADARSLVPMPGGRIAEVAGSQVVMLAP